MDIRPKLEGDDQARSAVVDARKQTRRRLLRKSLGTAPVLLSISSGPAIAGNLVKTASAKCSASTSAPTRGQYSCDGKSHVRWSNDACDSTKNNGGQPACKTSGHGWPCVPTTKHVGSYSPQVRSSCGESWSTTADHYQVMNRHCARAGTTVDKYWSKQELQNNPSSSAQRLKLAAHCSAALLSCEAGLIPAQVCNQDKIREIWEACKSGSGTWTPPGSSCTLAWTIDDACNWLNSMCTS
ncbi:hypothetical protein [Aquabacterium sp.]|uniref:hypothetical protein n=1 Tax=Aquabacterium sp. TaxID=1872578 RepID=UPI002C8662D4|nr:hypothetical protein [Aquabacterium sp.]HSW06820.1 hypothetical protein [Aquabacterium sp.]